MKINIGYVCNVNKLRRLLVIIGIIVTIPILYILFIEPHQYEAEQKPQKLHNVHINKLKQLINEGIKKNFSQVIKNDDIVHKADKHVPIVVHEASADNTHTTQKLVVSNGVVTKTTDNMSLGANQSWGKPKTQNIPDNEEIDIIANYYPNIPIKYWKKIENVWSTLYLSNSSCAPFPHIFKLNVHNTFWQTVHMTESTTIQLYSAYYDKREICNGKDVRILAMVNRTKINFPGNKTIYCQLWFEDESDPVIAPMNKLDYIWIDYWNNHQDGVLGPYLLGCSIPESHEDKVPQVVSLVENPCDQATNLLLVIYEEPIEKKEFSVCVKGLDFLQIDLSVRLVEWIEITLLMGVDKIYFYELEVHPNIKKVLNYYSKLGKVDVTLTTLPGANANIPLLQHEYLVHNNQIQCLDEIIPYNDCFYRNLYSHDYVALLDIDEIIIPLKDKNWHDLIERTKQYEAPGEKFNSFTARNIFFMDNMQNEGPYPDIPPYMHMMQHVFRSQNFTSPGEYVKTIFSTNYTICCHNHWAIAASPDSISRDFNLDEARMQHYRKNCPFDIDCKDYSIDPVKDTRLWDFKENIITRVNEALKNIGLIDENS